MFSETVNNMIKYLKRLTNRITRNTKGRELSYNSFFVQVMEVTTAFQFPAVFVALDEVRAQGRDNDQSIYTANKSKQLLNTFVKSAEVSK